MHIHDNTVWGIDFDECFYRKTPENQSIIYKNRHSAFRRALKKTVCSHLSELDIKQLVDQCIEQTVINQTSLENEIFSIHPLTSEHKQPFNDYYVMNDAEVHEFSMAVKDTITDLSLLNDLPGKKVIFTDNIEFTIRRFFDNWNIDFDTYFDGLFDINSGQCYTKKELITFQLFEQEYSVTSSDCLLIDDSTKNISQSNAAGWKPGILTTPIYTMDDAFKDILIHTR